MSNAASVSPVIRFEVVDKVVFVNKKEAPRASQIQYINNYCTPKGAINPRIFPKGGAFNEDNYGPIIVPRKGDVIKLTSDNVEEWRTIIDREFGENVVTAVGAIIYD